MGYFDGLNLPGHSQIIICGGGIAGASVAYHLAKLGCKDIVLLERHQITSGTTWHAAGLIMQLRSTHSMTGLAKYNVELYASLESDTGVAPGFKQNGTLGVCRSAERLYETRKGAAIAKSFAIDAHIISPSEAREIYPAIDARNIEGAVYIPADGQTNPVDTTRALIAGAKQRGVKVIENCKVEQLTQRAGGEYQLDTGIGRIVCEKLVLACGLWTRELAAQLGVFVPLYPCEHYYVLTESLSAVTPDLPVLRDTDGHNYVKEDAGRWLVGSFEPQGKPLDFTRIPRDVPFIELPENWDQFELPYTRAAELLPDLRTAGIARFFSGPESFTPDLLFMLGEVSGMANLFVSAGYNSEGIELNPAAGRALAEWIVQGAATLDLSEVSVNRFDPFQNNTRYLRARSAEVLGLHYKMHWPHRQKESARGVRKSVLHDRWADLNASFQEAAGWERPAWFAPQDAANENVYSYRRPNWFEQTAKECQAARSDAVIFDQSSFGKFLLQGKSALDNLTWLCAHNVDVPCGRIVYTQMLNERGGIEVDLTVNRLSEREFLLITSATSAAQDDVWIRKNLARPDDVVLTDVTRSYAVLSIQGPKSREILQEVSPARFDNVNFPFAASQEIELGYGMAIANRLTFIAELGWELLIASEFAQDIFDRIMVAGQQYGLRPAGYHALEHLRLEAAYREFGLDITPDDTPVEAGLGRSGKWNEPGSFLGQAALLSQLQLAYPEKRLVAFRLVDPEPVIWGEEVIYLDGKVAGYLSSGAYSFTLGSSVGLGYVHYAGGVEPDLIEHGSWEIDIAGERYQARASFRSFFDPERSKSRS